MLSLKVWQFLTAHSGAGRKSWFCCLTTKLGIQPSVKVRLNRKVSILLTWWLWFVKITDRANAKYFIMILVLKCLSCDEACLQIPLPSSPPLSSVSVPSFLGPHPPSFLRQPVLRLETYQCLHGDISAIKVLDKALYGPWSEFHVFMLRSVIWCHCKALENSCWRTWAIALPDLGIADIEKNCWSLSLALAWWA